MTPSQREGHRRDSNGSSQSKWNCRDSSPITEPWVQFRHDLVLASSWSNQIQSPPPQKTTPFGRLHPIRCARELVGVL